MKMNRSNLVRFLLLTIGILTSITLTSCYESNSEEDPPAPVVGPGGGGSVPDPGTASNGKIYFQQNCAICHSAGADDTTTAFGAIDLAQQQSIISNDISQSDQTFNIMARFNNIDQERVDDLKKYLSTL